MRTIFDAVEDAATRMKVVQAKDAFTGDVKELKAATSMGKCTCRGKCGGHTGPCGSKVAKGGITCKACTMSMSKK